MVKSYFTGAGVRAAGVRVAVPEIKLGKADVRRDVRVLRRVGQPDRDGGVFAEHDAEALQRQVQAQSALFTKLSFSVHRR